MKNVLQQSGIRNIINTSEEMCINYLISQVKQKICIELSFRYVLDIDPVTKILKRYDRNFERHCSKSFSGLNKGNHPRYMENCLIPVKNNLSVFVLVDDYREKKDGDTYIMRLFIFGKKRKKFADFIQRKVKENIDDEMYCYSITSSESHNMSWESVKDKITKRTFDTLYFDNYIEENIKRHLDIWSKKSDLYQKKGLLFKTGILLYGSPGTGKSSIATAIASYMNCDMISIDMSTIGDMSLSSLTTVINNDSERYIILLDEIDTIVSNRDDGKEKENNKIIKLLNFLDSVNSPTNCIFVATTNYIEKLDSALLRKGRFDLVLEVKDISYDTAVKMCKGFNMNENDIVNLLGEKNEYKTYNPAELQFRIIDYEHEKMKEGLS